MWQSLIDQKERWIGGRLICYGDSTDRVVFKDRIPIETEIIDLTLNDESFYVLGKEFRCGGSRKYVGLATQPLFPVPEGGLAFQSYDSHEFHIVPRLLVLHEDITVKGDVDAPGFIDKKNR